MANTSRHVTSSEIHFEATFTSEGCNQTLLKHHTPPRTQSSSNSLNAKLMSWAYKLSHRKRNLPSGFHSPHWAPTHHCITTACFHVFNGKIAHSTPTPTEAENWSPAQKSSQHWLAEQQYWPYSVQPASTLGQSQYQDTTQCQHMGLLQAKVGQCCIQSISVAMSFVFLYILCTCTTRGTWAL